MDPLHSFFLGDLLREQRRQPAAASARLASSPWHVYARPSVRLPVTTLIVLASLINLAPVLGVLSPERLRALYGIPFVLTAWRVGGCHAELRRVAVVDVLGSLALVGALVLDRLAGSQAGSS